MSSLQPCPEELSSRLFSVVIIGGGTAGLVLAARLSEDPSTSVLVLEAGENRLSDPNIDTPAFMVKVYENSNYDWCIKSSPQPNLNNRIIAQPRGRVLGGSSAINFMMATHPSASDIDAWGQLGNAGWDWASLEPYYQRSETLQVTSENIAAANILDPKLYGTDGPVQISLPYGSENENTVDTAWLQTMKALDLSAKDDPRSGATLGVYTVLKLIDKTKGWTRSYAARAYYEPVRSRKNLVVCTGIRVSKIVFEEKPIENDGPGFVAKGVEFESDGKKHMVRAGRDVILSAGALLSPQILELSGVGDPAVLGKAGVETKMENLNVGENLQDHPLTCLAFEAIRDVSTGEALRNPEVLAYSIAEFQAGRGGPLATGVHGTSFITRDSMFNNAASAPLLVNQAKISHSLPRPSQIHIQNLLRKQTFKLTLQSATEADVQINFAAMGIDPYCGESLRRAFAHTDRGNYLGLSGALNHPFSRGSVHIKTSDPNDLPTVDPNYFADPLGFEMMVDTVIFMQTIAETSPFADFISDRENGHGKKFMPVFGIEQRLDRQRAEKLVQESAISSWHPIGTCAMLPKEDGGVVDPRLRVYGIENLRVVDASIMPLHVRGNICSSVYAIAEKAADLIKEDWLAKN
ncbi:hypothetical protein GGI43DRAFT_385302 [Trichoderma evansii]